MDPILLRAEEVAELLGLGRTKVFELLSRHELPIVRIGRSVRVPRAALQEWVANATREPAERHEGDRPCEGVR
jgi:excisionase family DNA binding protein